MPENYRGDVQPPGNVRQLTQELSRQNPERYRERLLDSLHAQTRYTGQAWALLKSRGVFDENSISLDPETWVSETRIDPRNPGRKTIRIGTQELTPRMREQLIFEDARFKDDKGIVYRLSHEIGHEVGFIATSISTKTRNLFETVVKMREAGHAISSLGSMDLYRSMGADVQASEDVVELINMYMIEPAYLDRYLKFLRDPQFQGQRQRLGLYTIPNERIAEMLSKSVEDGVTKLLSA